MVPMPMQQLRSGFRRDGLAAENHVGPTAKPLLQVREGDRIWLERVDASSAGGHSLGK